MNIIPMSSTATQLGRQDRRQYLRIKAAVQVELRAQESEVPIRAQTTDISLGGFYVEMSVTLAVGTRVDAVLWLGEKKIRGSGVVATCHPQFGNGVELRLSPQDQANLAAFLDSLGSPAPAPLIQ